MECEEGEEAEIDGEDGCEWGEGLRKAIRKSWCRTSGSLRVKVSLLPLWLFV